MPRLVYLLLLLPCLAGPVCLASCDVGVADDLGSVTVTLPGNLGPLQASSSTRITAGSDC